MVLVEAVIKHFKLDDVKEALEEIGVGGITVTEVLQASPTRLRSRAANSSETRPDLVPKTKIEIVVPSDMVERTVEAICVHGSTGKNEDGVVVVKRIDGAVRIRTGETDSAAIML
jgi:nitrogen regulatory protein PII